MLLGEWGGGGGVEKEKLKPGEGGLSAAWDEALLVFQSALSACSEHGKP